MKPITRTRILYARVWPEGGLWCVAVLSAEAASQRLRDVVVRVGMERSAREIATTLRQYAKEDRQ